LRSKMRMHSSPFDSRLRKNLMNPPSSSIFNSGREEDMVGNFNASMMGWRKWTRLKANGRASGKSHVSRNSLHRLLRPLQLFHQQLTASLTIFLKCPRSLLRKGAEEVHNDGLQLRPILVRSWTPKSSQQCSPFIMINSRNASMSVRHRNKQNI
jgi:hypothetical protein